jgi:hypothetical protein
MTPPPLRFVFAWVFGALLVSGSSPSTAAPAKPAAMVTPALRGSSGQLPQKLAATPPLSVFAMPVATATTPTEPTAAMGVSESRNALERGMTELGELAIRARQSGDMVRIACVQDEAGPRRGRDGGRDRRPW